MNQFVNLFENRIKTFWDDGEDATLHSDVLKYANADPQKFKAELREIQFDEEIDPLPVVLEAFSKDTDKWGSFYVEQLDEILSAAKKAQRPSEVLTYLLELVYIENDDRPFVQQIVDRLHKEINSENSTISRAAIWNLPTFIDNKSIRNRSTVINSLQEKLHDKNWRTRFVAYEALRFENLLPETYKQPLLDRIRVSIFGKPYDFM